MGTRVVLSAVAGIAAAVAVMPAPAGTVAAGMAAPAGVVAPVPEPPDVTGLTRAVAEEELRDWRPDVELTYLPATEQLPPGTDPDRAVVEKQGLRNPKWLAAQQPPSMELALAARVPTLVGLRREPAERLLTEHGLRVLTEPRAPEGSWVVGAQRPAALELVRFGTPVLLVLRRVASPDPRVPVPDLAGLSVDEARLAVTAAGLAFDLRALGDAGGAPGAVRDQAPAAGTLVPAGSRVTATVQLRASPAPPASPPRPVGLTTVQAVGLGAGILLALLILLAAAVLVLRRGRLPRAPAELVGPVSVRVHPGRVTGPVVRDIGTRPSVATRVEAHPDPGRVRVEEAVR